VSPAAAAARPRRPVPTRLAEIADVVQLRGPGAPRRRVRVVPDARVDVYWAEGHLAALGVVHGPRILEVSGPSVRVQLRFGRTRIIGDPAALLPGEPVALTEYWGAQARGLEQVLSSSGDPREHLHRIEEILLRRAAQEPVDRLLLAAARRLARPTAPLARSRENLMSATGSCVAASPTSSVSGRRISSSSYGSAVSSISCSPTTRHPSPPPQRWPAMPTSLTPPATAASSPGSHPRRCSAKHPQTSSRRQCR